VLFLEPQPGFQRVGIRFVDFVSQAGFLDPLTEAAMRNCESRAGTCLMATMIFIKS